MLILTIRTDRPEAEIGLFDDRTEIVYQTWLAHRQLAETLHRNIQSMLAERHVSLQQLEGIVCFQGPGSFTGLRIGAAVANAVAYSLEIPIVSTAGDWQQAGIRALLEGRDDHSVVPEYGAAANITAPKK